MPHAHRPGIVKSRGGVLLALKRGVAGTMVGGDKEPSPSTSSPHRSLLILNPNISPTSSIGLRASPSVPHNLPLWRRLRIKLTLTTSHSLKTLTLDLEPSPFSFNFEPQHQPHIFDWTLSLTISPSRPPSVASRHPHPPPHSKHLSPRLQLLPRVHPMLLMWIRGTQGDKLGFRAHLLLSFSPTAREIQVVFYDGSFGLASNGDTVIFLP
ncbi:hypothetical protein JHK84_050984 [Glycine max]|nr:hypothetical protein JHK84_050984 [Glycine max]